MRELNKVIKGRDHRSLLASRDIGVLALLKFKV